MHSPEILQDILVSTIFMDNTFHFLNDVQVMIINYDGDDDMTHYLYEGDVHDI